MKYYRVYTGFGPDDFIAIDEMELEMCVRAQITGKVAITKEGTITGSVIQRIVPDWNRVMGYNRLYKLQNEDYKQVGDKMIEEYRIALQSTTTSVQRLLAGLPKLPEETKEAVSPKGMRELVDRLRLK